MARNSEDAAIIRALASGATMKAAAQAAGVSEATVRRRVNTRQVSEAVRQERNKMNTQIGARLMMMSLHAADYLMTVVRDPSEATHNRVRASAILMAESRARQDAELAERLDEIEAELVMRSN